MQMQYRQEIYLQYILQTISVVSSHVFVTFVKHLNTVVMANTYIDRGQVIYTILGWIAFRGRLTVVPYTYRS